MPLPPVALGLLVLLAAPTSTEPTWTWPTAGHQVSRPFSPGPTPYSPGHRGVDLPGLVGQAVLATGAGRVSYAGLLAGRGVVVVVHGALRTTYEPVVAGVRVGQTVAAGQRLGKLAAGHSGCAASACLHWGLRRGRDYLDPMSLLRPGPVRLLPSTGGGPAGGSSGGSSGGGSAGGRSAGVRALGPAPSGGAASSGASDSTASATANGYAWAGDLWAGDSADSAASASTSADPSAGGSSAGDSRPTASLAGSSAGPASREDTRPVPGLTGSPVPPAAPQPLGAGPLAGLGAAVGVVSAAARWAARRRAPRRS